MEETEGLQLYSVFTAPRLFKNIFQNFSKTYF